MAATLVKIAGTTTVKTRGMSLSRFIWRHFGQRDPQVLTAALALNRHLANATELPLGATVYLPMGPTSGADSTAAQAEAIVQLFD
ncbi:hypothetical protein [Polycladidibacter hongkongensis]|uniref:hypothetical protein n=1 Tax=Polycladidibacter hongkongensis TaxID=1647556 RepID=UPI00082AB8CA|nr:hypothetical protein [Pseudovibrio hongkongensis]